MEATTTVTKTVTKVHVRRTGNMNIHLDGHYAGSLSPTFRLLAGPDYLASPEIVAQVREVLGR